MSEHAFTPEESAVDETGMRDFWKDRAQEETEWGSFGRFAHEGLSSFRETRKGC